MRSLIVLLACALSAGACTLGNSTQPGIGFVAGDGATDLPPEERQPAPDITGETLEGDRLALAGLQGPVVVNFWASWCGPCAEESPDLSAIAEEFADEGVHVVGVNVRDERVNARSFQRDHRLPYPSWYDDDSSIAHRFGAVGALPSTLLLDAEHRVAARLYGAVTAAELSVRLDALLEERRS